MEDVTLDDALALLAEKGKTLKPRGAAARKQARGGRAGAKNAASRPAESPIREAAPKKKKAASRGRAAKPKRAARPRRKQAAE
jgi:DNA topoisomerase-1